MTLTLNPRLRLLALAGVLALLLGVLFDCDGEGGQTNDDYRNYHRIGAQPCTQALPGGKMCAS